MPSKKSLPNVGSHAQHISDDQTFNLMFEGHSAIMLLVEPEAGNILDANQAAVVFYGYSKSKLCSMSIYEINTLPPEQIEVERLKALNEERNYFVFPHRLASGEERMVEVHSSPITLHKKQVLFSIIHDVTERTLVEKDLRESEEKFRNIVKYATDGIILTDERGIIVEWNPAQEKILEFEYSEAIGQPLWDIQFQRLRTERQTPEVHKRIKALSQEMLTSGVIFEHVREQETMIQNLGGVERIIRSAIFSIKTTHGFQLASISRDITERKQMEDLLKKTRTNYEAFFNSIDDFLFVLDEQGNILHTNQTVTDRLGYSTEELFGKSVLMVHPPERREEAGRIVGEMLAGTAEFCPVPIMKKSGAQIPVETRVTPGFWDGKPVIFGVTKDISQIKLSEEKFSKAFQSNSALMALSRFEDGVYIDVNDIFLKTLGFTRNEVIGKTSRELSLFASVDQRNKIVEIIKQNKTVKDVEVPVRTKDGSLRDGLFSADIIYIGKDQCLLTVMVDITERKRTADALRESEERLREVLENSLDASYKRDLHTNDYDYLSPIFTQISGYTLDTLKTLPIEVVLSLIHPDDQAEIERVIAESLLGATGTAYQVEYRFKHKDGQYRWFHDRFTIMRDAQNQPLARIGSVSDITERKRLENINAEYAARFDISMMAASMAWWEMDIRTGLVIFDHRKTDMLGYSSEDFHHYKDFMTLVHPDDYDNAMNAMRKYFAGQTDKYETDYRILTKSNGYKWFHDAGSIIKKDSKGLPLKIAGIVIDITEHKRLDALRQEALNRLEKIASLVPGLVYQYRLRPDGSSCFPFASEAINEVYRVSPEEVREDASKVFANLHPDDLDGVAASIQASAQDLSPWQHEYRVKFEDGTIRFLYGSAVPQREEDGSTLWHGFIADITERKRAEERISQLANELQGTLDTVTAGISHLKDRKVEWANAAHDEIFGYSIGETRGMETSALYPDRASFERLGQEAYPQLMAGKTYDTEIEMQKKDGTHIWCSLTGHMMNVSQPADGSIWMIQDISERKQTEEALRESERFAHATVDAIAGEITILDETGVIIEVNRAWRALAMTEASVPVAVCEGANYLAVCDATRGPDAVYAKAIGNGIRTVISGKQTVFSLEYPCEFSVGSRTEKHWFNAKVTRFAGDGPIRIVVAHENITARKHAEESLQQQNIYLSTLHQITLDLLNHRNMDELLQTIVDRAVILLDAPFGELMLEKDGELIVQTCTQNQASLVGERNGRAKAKLSWLAFDTKQPVVLEDYSTYEYHESIYTEYALCAVAEFPILVRDKCIGVLSLGRVKPEYIFTEMQVKNGSLFAQLVALVLDNAQLFSAAEHEIAERKQIEADLRLAKETLDSAHQKLGQSFVREQTLARTDTLTGINNRRFLFEIAEREFNVAMRYRPPLSMLMFDIDHFKHINDTFGHSMGDHVLQQVTQVVCAEVRSADVIGRYGGDEFVILLPQTDTQESLPLAERIHASVATIRIPTDKDPLVVTISLGIAQTSHGASQPDTVENLFLRADQALYSAKQAGRNCTRIFEINSK